MIPKDDGTRGPPIGVLSLLDPDINSNNSTPTQAILSIYKSYRDFTNAARRHSSASTGSTIAATTVATNGFNPNTTLCTYSIPSYMSVPDFLNFVAPVDSFVSHYRVLCDDTKETYLVLMTFRDEKVRHDYYKQYNKRKFSSMEDQVCQVLYINTIQLMATSGHQHDGTTTSTGDHARFFSLENDDDDATGIHNNCPVCLDPMDESITGLLTTLCQHTFHVHCLSQWGDGSCPVCRYSQKPTTTTNETNSPPAPLLPLARQQKQQFFLNMDPSAGNNTSTTSSSSSGFFQQDSFTNACHDCGSTEHLWICLVCGQIGCGQDQEAHALIHYTATHHVYAIDIDSQRVWDYAGDNYVHRLIQNVVDGKLVELPHPMQQQQQDDASLSDMVQGKLNAMALEYSYLLTSQLDSQRMYYEDRINTTLDTLTQMSDRCKQTTQELDTMHSEMNDDVVSCLADQVEAARKHNTRLVHKVAQWKDKTKTMERNYLEEKELTRSISENNTLVKNDIDKVQRHLDLMAAKSAEWMACLEQDGPGNEPSAS